MAPVSFQILSDLHLETHPSYDSFTFAQTAANLALLGDIGHVANNQLIIFLQAYQNRYSVVFFVLGNHEPYHMSFKTAKLEMSAFQARIDKRSSTMGKHVFLDQTRYDLTSDLTVLGCTLFSRISPKQDFAVESRMLDFRDILRWTTLVIAVPSLMKMGKLSCRIKTYLNPEKAFDAERVFRVGE